MWIERNSAHISVVFARLVSSLLDGSLLCLLLVVRVEVKLSSAVVLFLDVIN